MRRGCRHHRLYLLQRITEITVVLLRRRRRFGVERSPRDNLVDDDASTSSPQWSKYRARIDKLVGRRSLVCAYDGHRSRQALRAGGRVLQTERDVQLDGSAVRQTMGEMHRLYVRIGHTFDRREPRFELIDALVDRDKVRVVRVDVWNFWSPRRCQTGRAFEQCNGFALKKLRTVPDVRRFG